MWKYFPWVYFPQNVEKYDFYWNRRKERKFLEDKIYFRGTSLEYRKIISYLNPDLFHGGRPIGGFDAYAEELLNYKVGLSTAGRGEFCYRDIEYMAMGVPFIRFKYNSEMSPELIPNVHYISVDRPEDMPHDRDCTPEHTRLLEQRFLQVKDDQEFLDFIVKNAREYYEKHITINNCVAHTIKLLELEKW
jgi:glycosyltransferase involved in cell wall biosynthesis